MNKTVFFCEFSNFKFLNFSKREALGDFLVSFLEKVISKGCLGGISQNLIFRNRFEILDIIRYWLLRFTSLQRSYVVFLYTLGTSPASVKHCTTKYKIEISNLGNSRYRRIQKGTLTRQKITTDLLKKIPITKPT